MEIQRGSIFCLVRNLGVGIAESDDTLLCSEIGNWEEMCAAKVQGLSKRRCECGVVFATAEEQRWKVSFSIVSISMFYVKHQCHLD